MTERVNHKLERKAFGDRLRSAMFAQRVGAETLGVRAGLSPRLVKKYMTGDVAPMDWFGDPTPNAHKLANALGVPVDVLIPQRDDDLTPAA